MRRPNILVLMVDQLNPAFLPSYGHPLVKAPHLSALADSGVQFDAAYCNSPLCSPSRAVMMSGRLPSKTAVYDNAAEFAADIPTFAHYLRRDGYRTILSGKMHFCGPDQLHGFEERLTTDIYPADYGWTPDWDRPHDRPSWYHNMSSVTQAGPCIRTNQLDFDDEVTFAAERRLYDIARDSDERPFCLVASLTHPHDPYAIPARYWSLYRDDEIDMPAVTIDPADQDPHSRRLRAVCAMDAEPVSDQQIRNARRAYYGAIAYVDDQIGRLLTALKDTGLADDTIIVFLGDHGDMLGERGLWYKMNFFEGSTRIPLIISKPGWLRPARVAAAVSLVDLLPTLIDFARDGAAPDLVTAIEGRSLLPHLNGSGGHDEVIGEYLAEGAVAPLVMIRQGRFKFIHSPADPDQLYDLSNDPQERINLAADPALAGALTDWRTKVAQRFDLAALDAAVRASQRRRRLVDQALMQGVNRPWDFQPFTDAAKQYMRNTIALDDLEAMARFPRVGGA